MSTPALQAASAMLAACEAVRLYGADHETSRHAFAFAAAAVVRALEARSKLMLVALNGCLAVSTEKGLFETTRLDAMAEFMTRARIGWIGCQTPPTEAEVASFVTMLSRGSTPPESESFKFGVLGAGPAAGVHAQGDAPRPQHAPVAPDECMGELASVLTHGSQPIGVQKLESLVDSISVALRAGKDAFLPMAALKTHDEYTYIHAVNVAIMSASLSEHAGLSSAASRDILLGGLLHDIGKRMLSKDILTKSGPLSAEERRLVDDHPAQGARMLIEHGKLPDVLPVIAFEHHLHADGKGGYPRLAGRCKPTLAGQIVHIADTFDALCTHRPYRKALSCFEASRLMYAQSGSVFDPDLLNIFFERIVSRLPPSSLVKPALQSEDSSLAA